MITLSNSVAFTNYNAFHDYQNMTYNLLDFFIDVQIKPKLT